MSLQRLISQAVALGGGNLCAAGHDWKSEGGRGCPRSTEDFCPPVSQTVYQCVRCGEYDYGDAGGPAYRECIEQGPCDSACIPLNGDKQHG